MRTRGGPTERAALTLVAASLIAACAARSAVVPLHPSAPAPSGPPAGGGQPNFGESAEASRRALASFLSQVARQVRPQWNPAERWRRLDPDGTRFGTGLQSTLLTVEVAPDGSLTSVRIESPSGAAELDQAAQETVRGAAPFPPPPLSFVDGGRVRFRLEMSFAVTEGTGYVAAEPAPRAPPRPIEDDDPLLAKKWKFASFFNRVKQQVRDHWHPAEEWHRRDPTGRVYGRKDRYTLLAVELAPDGSLLALKLEVPSGVEFLDDAAVEAFRAATPFRDPPEQLVVDGRIRFKFGFYFELAGKGEPFKVFGSPPSSGIGPRP